MKIIFMGTPDFAVGTLDALVEAGHEVSLVVTQPDRVKGRGKTVSMPPVKECALRHDIPVFQPEKVKENEAVMRLRAENPDIIVVAAFGQILSKEILELPKYGCINVHASLLPKYRGAAPIQWSIIDGEEKTGVTIMQMNEGLDTGDILTQREVPILSTETGGSLFDKLAETGASLCVQTISEIEEGNIKPVKQDDSCSSYAKMLKKELGQIDFSESAENIERLVRALNPWPSAYTKLDGEMLKLWETEVVQEDSESDAGMITDVSKDYFTVSCGKGQLKVLSLQKNGKKRMTTHDFLLGHPLKKGTALGQ